MNTNNNHASTDQPQFRNREEAIQALMAASEGFSELLLKASSIAALLKKAPPAQTHGKN